MKSTSNRSISLHKNDKAKSDKINKHRDSTHYRERKIHGNTNRLQFLSIFDQLQLSIFRTHLECI